MPHGLQKFLHENTAIVKCDENGLVAVEKPCGVLSHPNAGNDPSDALFRCPYDFDEQAYTCKGFGKVYLLNRLDAPVSGVILVGLNPKVAEAVKIAFESKKVFKQYVALVKGYPRYKNAVWRSRLDKNFIGKSIKMSPGSGFFAETKCFLVESFRLCGVTLSILNLFPVTGRTHQLRVHCSQHALPIVGDETYGDAKFNAVFKKNYESYRLFLHSEKISLTYVLGRKIFTFHAHSSINFVELLKNFIGNHIRSSS
ncbi:MAG: RluA family pseudouridine synthase [Puniceicoccales bacterium]|nr:RluA family pseudouridine synthase [Puniceicoccales bacterium]